MLYVYVALLCGIFSLDGSPPCVTADADAMAGLKSLLNVPEITWPSSKHYCSWEGITCNWIRADACFGQVVEIAVAEFGTIELSETGLSSAINFPCIQSGRIDLSSYESSPSFVESLLVALPPTIVLRFDSSLCVGETW